jgi:hypothetical protein
MANVMDADVAAHMLVIEQREAEKCREREKSLALSHPKNLAEWIGEGDIVDSPPIVERPAKHSTQEKI